MSEEENKAMVRRFYDEVWHQANIAAVDALFAAEFVNHDPGPHSPDREGFKEYVRRAQRNANYRPSIEDLIAEGDKVVARLTGRGRLRRKFLGITIVDREFEQQGIVMWRVAGGKIVERWAVWEE